MKRLLKIIMITFLLIPFTIYAKIGINYNGSLNYVNNYILNFSKYTRYIVCDNSNYVYNSSGFDVDPFFENSGYLNLYEFQIAGGVSSYLWKGDHYHTMTSDIHDKIYNIVSSVSSLGYELFNKNTVLDNEFSGVKVAQYIKSKTKVKGKGTYSNPWMFIDIEDSEAPETVIFTPNNVANTSWTVQVKIIENINESGLKRNQSIKYLWTKGACASDKSSYTSSPLLYTDEFYADASISSKSFIEDNYTGKAKLCVYNDIIDENDNVSNEIISKEYEFDNGVAEITYDEIIKSYWCKNHVPADDLKGEKTYLMKYTGNCEVIQDYPTGDTDLWKVRLTSNGYLSVGIDSEIDAFLVGGGGGGGNAVNSMGGSGGGGGRTQTIKGFILQTSLNYYIEIGGSCNKATTGKQTKAFDVTVQGGSAGKTPPTYPYCKNDSSICVNGANGGSGGGGAGCCQATSNGSNPGNGGSYGSGGTGNNRTSGNGTSGGNGQANTTCEFDEGTRSGCNRGRTYAYSGGGGGGGGWQANIPVGTPGICNGYGCGGNGAKAYNNVVATGGKQGVVLIRNHRDK